MKSFAKIAIPMVGGAAFMLAVSFVPLIPIISTPVVPSAISTSTFISIAGIFTNPFLCGMRYEATWATLPAMVGLSVAAIFAGWKVGRRLVGRD